MSAPAKTTILRHFVATGYVVRDHKTLLVFHKNQFKAEPKKLVIGGKSYRAAWGGARNLPNITKPTAATLELADGTVIPVRLVRQEVH